MRQYLHVVWLIGVMAGMCGCSRERALAREHLRGAVELSSYTVGGGPWTIRVVGSRHELTADQAPAQRITQHLGYVEDAVSSASGRTWAVLGISTRRTHNSAQSRTPGYMLLILTHGADGWVAHPLLIPDGSEVLKDAGVADATRFPGRHNLRFQHILYCSDDRIVLGNWRGEWLVASMGGAKASSSTGQSTNRSAWIVTREQPRSGEQIEQRRVRLAAPDGWELVDDDDDDAAYLVEVSSGKRLYLGRDGIERYAPRPYLIVRADEADGYIWSGRAGSGRWSAHDFAKAEGYSPPQEVRVSPNRSAVLIHTRPPFFDYRWSIAPFLSSRHGNMPIITWPGVAGRHSFLMWTPN